MQVFTKILLGLGILVIFSHCSPKVQHLAQVDQRNIRMDEVYQSNDDAIIDIIAPYKEGLDKIMDEVIGYSTEILTKGKPHSTLTNFMADMILDGSQEYYDQPIDIAFQNYGGVRVNSLPKGPITIRNIYELMPFENTLVIIELDGASLLPLLHRIADYGGWPISHGSSFEIKDSIYAHNIIINGKPFDEKESYVIALPDYIANGGDNVKDMADAKRLDTGILIRDLIIAEIRKNKTINPDNKQRIYYAQ